MKRAAAGQHDLVVSGDARAAFQERRRVVERGPRPSCSADVPHQCRDASGRFGHPLQGRFIAPDELSLREVVQRRISRHRKLREDHKLCTGAARPLQEGFDLPHVAFHVRRSRIDLRDGDLHLCSVHASCRQPPILCPKRTAL